MLIDMNLSINSKPCIVRSVDQAKIWKWFWTATWDFDRNKIARAVGILYKLKYLPVAYYLKMQCWTFFMLYYILFLFMAFLCGVTFFLSYLTKYSKLQNKVIRIVTEKNWSDSASPLYQKMNMLRLVSLLN